MDKGGKNKEEGQWLPASAMQWELPWIPAACSAESLSNFHYWRNQQPAQLPQTPCRFHWFCFPPLHCPCQTLRSTLAASPGLSGCSSARCKSIPHDWPLPAAPPAVHLHATILTSVTDVHCHVHICGEIWHLWECTLTAKIPTSVSGADLALSPVTGLQLWAHLQLAPKLCTCTPLSWLSSLAFTAVHTPMERDCSHRSALQQPGSLQLPVHPQLVLTLETGTAPHPPTIWVSAASPCHSTGACSWPPELWVCTPPAPAAAAACPGL